MLVYGYVNEIETYNIKMSLPNGMMGTVPITDVSPAYTELIQQFAAKSETEQEQEGEVTIKPFELWLEKACLWSFRPGPTLTT